MPRRLRILAGPSTSELKPLAVNSGKSTDVSSDAFVGSVAVFVKGFGGLASSSASSAGDSEGEGMDGEEAYFGREERGDVTWSIQVQGRFLREYAANDILFGNVFDKPLPIPWGFSTILGFMQYIDPTLEHDLTSQTKPWALSPLVSTMPHLAHAPHSPESESSTSTNEFPPIPPIHEATSQLRTKDGRELSELSANAPAKRRAYFRAEEKRKEVVFGPQDVLTADFCYGYLSFSPSTVALRLPGGFSIDLLRFWDGQPVYFVCCERVKERNVGGEHPIGRVFWCVAIEILDEAEEENGDSDDESSDSECSEEETRWEDVRDNGDDVD